MHTKASIVACGFSVQCFENATIVACAGLRVKPTHFKISFMIHVIKNVCWLFACQILWAFLLYVIPNQYNNVLQNEHAQKLVVLLVSVTTVWQP